MKIKGEHELFCTKKDLMYQERDKKKLRSNKKRILIYMNNKNKKKYLQVNKKYMIKSIEKLTEPNILLQIFLQKITPKIIA